MLAPYGLLVTKVTHKKQTYRTLSGVDAPLRSICCALCHVWLLSSHTTADSSILEGETEIVMRCYSLCENNDKFAINRPLPVSQNRDINRNSRYRCSWFFIISMPNFVPVEIPLWKKTEMFVHSSSWKTRRLFCDFLVDLTLKIKKICIMKATQKGIEIIFMSLFLAILLIILLLQRCICRNVYPS